jgi:geranylgeranyl diphosphate synthase, type II
VSSFADTGTAEWPAGAVDEHLEAIGRDMRRAMLDEIPDGVPHAWLYRLARDYPSRPGKAIRPALCLAACEAFGGDEASIRPIAVVIELLHNAFLVHDDIVDGSERRRGRATLPAQYGAALALNAGDALAVLANQVLRRHTRAMNEHVADRVLEEFDTMALRTLEGQATELGWRRDVAVDLTPEHYLELIMHKTCWYTTVHPLRVGALVGSDDTADLRPMVRFGFYLGAAFQIQDDLLNLTGDEASYGKEIRGDLYEGKRTLVLIHLEREARGADRRTVDQYLTLERHERTPELVAEVRALIHDYGSIEFALAYAAGIASAAVPAFEDAFGHLPPSPALGFLRSIIPYMLERKA